MTTVDKNYLHCDCSDGSKLNGIRERTLYSLV